MAVLAVLGTLHVVHGVWAATEAYASPSLSLSARLGNGTRVVYDDFRQGYEWLRTNTAQVCFLAAVVLARGDAIMQSTHARTHARTDARMYVRTDARMYVRTYARMYVRTHARTHAQTHSMN